MKSIKNEILCPPYDVETIILCQRAEGSLFSYENRVFGDDDISIDGIGEIICEEACNRSEGLFGIFSYGMEIE